VVWTEVCALRALLKHVGLGAEIETDYMTPLDRVKLTEEERSDLPARARAYIEYLEQEVYSLNTANALGTERSTEWRGSNAAEVRTSAARKIGVPLVARRGRSSLSRLGFLASA
jgi:Trp operon repressor